MKSFRVYALIILALPLGLQAIWLGGILAQDKEGVRREVRQQDGSPNALKAFLESATKPIRVEESSPVTINAVEFVLVSQAKWKAPAGRWEKPINIQLHICNKHERELVFSTVDTFGLTIKSADGTRIENKGGRDHLQLPPPVCVLPNGRYALCREATLRWDAANGSGEVRYDHGDGWVDIFRPLCPGKHTLTFWYAANPTGLSGIENAFKSWKGQFKADLSFEIEAP